MLNILNNMLTHETAQRLKAANFPQPAPAASQIWYDELGVGRYVGGAGKTLNLFNWQTGAVSLVSTDPTFWAEAAYCPTAADILPLLPAEHCIESALDGGFAVFRHAWDDTAPAESTHEDMDEALALAWLKINKKE